jgi:hypothetical protein
MNKTETQIEQTTLSKQNYYQECLQWAITYISNKKSGYLFNSDNLRILYSRENDKLPSEGRVWGPIIRSLQKEGLIQYHDTTMIQPKNANKRLQNFWYRV